MEDNEQSSSGHKLGQLVGDWFQDWFVFPVLQEVAEALGLYLDHRNAVRSRDVRGDRILWMDDENNSVDYDFVLELGGSQSKRGVPVSFFECFWRRGARHSKDKARDDSGKLMPMRSTYPTARFLGIVASGDFTRPARELIDSRRISLFYVPKAKIIETFVRLGMQMDYYDKVKEDVKARIAGKFEQQLTRECKETASQYLREGIGETAVKAYIASVKAALSSAPVEFRIVGKLLSKPIVFESVEAVTGFLENHEPSFDFSDPTRTYTYQVIYSDGAEFERDLASLDDLRTLHGQIAELASHMATVA